MDTSSSSFNGAARGSHFNGHHVPGRRGSPGDGGNGNMPKTLNEMEVELHSLHKENFDLKMSIYYQKVGLSLGLRGSPPVEKNGNCMLASKTRAYSPSSIDIVFCLVSTTEFTNLHALLTYFTVYI